MSRVTIVGDCDSDDGGDCADVVTVIGACGCDASDCEIVYIPTDSDEVVTLFTPGPPGPQGPVGPQGPSGGGFVDSGTRTSPNLISTSIPTTADGTLRVFIAGNGGPVSNPTLNHMAGNQTIILFGTSDFNTVTIHKSFGNYELSGSWQARNGSQLALNWDGVSKYTEAYRNEI